MVTETRSAIEDSLQRLLVDNCTGSVVREIEYGSGHAKLWTRLEASGFLDALVGEYAGGAGLSLEDAVCIPELCGRYAVPVPFTETVLLRGLLTAAGVHVPEGSLTMAAAAISENGSLVCREVQMGRLASAAVVDAPHGTFLLAKRDALASPATFLLDANLMWPASVISSATPLELGTSMEVVQAFVCAAQMGGAMMSVLARSLDYANQRRQFGKPIGKFQAIQHQLAVMAEHLFACRMAVELSAWAPELRLNPMRVAVAKARTSEAAATVSAMGHAIHGAIGFTEEYDLQLFTKRLAVWRRAAGSESRWQEKLGEGLTGDTRAMSLDLLRDLTDPTGTPASSRAAAQ